MTGLQPLDVKPDNLTDITFDAIRQSIVSKALPPGSRVSEQKIAAQLQVSKTPVREALLRLRHIGLVEPVERGLAVITPSALAIREAYELRASLEQTSAGLAANRASASQAEILFELAQESLTAARRADRAAFKSADRRFHGTVAAACGNGLLAEAIENSLTLTAVLRERDVPMTGDSVDCATEHVAVAEAIGAGQGDQAAQRMSDHVLHVMSMVLGATARAS